MTVTLSDAPSELREDAEDINRLVVKTEGEGEFGGGLESAECSLDLRRLYAVRLDGINHAFDMPCDQRRVGEAHHRRRIDDHVVVILMQQGDQLAEAVSREQLRRIWWDWSGGHRVDAEIIHAEDR